MSKNAFVNADGLLFMKSGMQRRVAISGCAHVGGARRECLPTQFPEHPSWLNTAPAQSPPEVKADE